VLSARSFRKGASDDLSNPYSLGMPSVKSDTMLASFAPSSARGNVMARNRVEQVPPEQAPPPISAAAIAASILQ
jgi:hypothetical protein